MKSAFIKVLVVVFLIGLIVFLLTRDQKPVKKGQYEISVRGNKIFVEILDTPTKRAKGLSGKGSLSENEGMLFVFEGKDVTPTFWMKGMQFAIDIIWINNGVVVGISENVQPEPGRLEAQLTLYRPPGPVDYVLEIPAGFSKKNHIGIGDTVEL